MREQEAKSLLGRFMAGETTLEEERMLSAYFRDNDVGDDLAPFQTMFAWFADGMPMDGDEPKLRSRDVGVGRRRMWRAVAAVVLGVAASVAALFLITAPWRGDGRGDASLSVKVPPTVAKIAAKTDTVAADTARGRTSEPAKRARRLRRGTYAPLHQRPLMARRECDSIDAVAVSMAEERLRHLERRQAAALEMIDERWREQSRDIYLMMAAFDGEADFDDEESTEEY